MKRNALFLLLPIFLFVWNEDSYAEEDGKKYVVQRGDTLSEIAMAQCHSWRNWKAFISANGREDLLRNPRHLKAGEVLILPQAICGKSLVAKKPAAVRKENHHKNQAVYVVLQGDTPSEISARHCSQGTWQRLMTENGLTSVVRDPRTLRAGARIFIPAKCREHKTAPTKNSKQHHQHREKQSSFREENKLSDTPLPARAIRVRCDQAMERDIAALGYPDPVPALLCIQIEHGMYDVIRMDGSYRVKGGDGVVHTEKANGGFARRYTVVSKGKSYTLDVPE